LLKKCGIDFNKLKHHGISPKYFAEKMTLSGLILNPNTRWICYHGCYDFAYMLKVLMNESLPPSLTSFRQHLKIFFPNVYDIKSFAPEFSEVYEGGGLNKLAESLGVKRIGTMH